MYHTCQVAARFLKCRIHIIEADGKCLVLNPSSRVTAAGDLHLGHLGTFCYFPLELSEAGRRKAALANLMPEAQTENHEAFITSSLQPGQAPPRTQVANTNGDSVPLALLGALKQKYPHKYEQYTRSSTVSQSCAHVSSRLDMFEQWWRRWLCVSRLQWSCSEATCKPD